MVAAKSQLGTASLTMSQPTSSLVAVNDLSNLEQGWPFSIDVFEEKIKVLCPWKDGGSYDEVLDEWRGIGRSRGTCGLRGAMMKQT